MTPVRRPSRQSRAEEAAPRIARALAELATALRNVDGVRSLQILAAIGIALTAVALSFGVLAADELGGQADYVATMEQAKGHLLVSREVYRRGEAIRGGVHASHPIQELGYRLWRPVTKVDKELGTRLQATLKDPGRAIEARVPAGEYDKVVERTLALMDRAVARAVPAERRADPRFQARVIQTLLVAVDEEYTEAIAEGRVVLAIEYQDAWGFFQRLHERWSTLRKMLGPSRPEMVSTVDGHMALLAAAFPAAVAPATPVAVERVVAALDAIATALAPLAPPRGGRR
jgi:hypothetical protein